METTKENDAVPAGDFPYDLKDYRLVLFGLLCVIITYKITILGFTGPARKRAFTKEFMAQFNEVHEKEIKTEKEPSANGYPDSGSGWYSK